MELKEAGAVKTRGLNACRGQGMVEYLLVLAVVIGTTVAAMSAISESASTVIRALVTHIQQVTGVEAPAN